jgi:hypothetical protein
VDIDNNQCFVSTLVNALPFPDPVVYLNADPDLDPDPVLGFEITDLFPITFLSFTKILKYNLNK